MKILIVSDTHGNFSLLQDVVFENSSIDTILHLGDGNGDVEEFMRLYPHKDIIAVRGNCDLFSELPDEQEFTLEGKKIFMTHGNGYGVKVGLSSICSVARKKSADILLFGHTHTAFAEEQCGLVMMNPGSLRGYSATYGIIEIDGSEVHTTIKSANKVRDVL